MATYVCRGRVTSITVDGSKASFTLRSRVKFNPASEGLSDDDITFNVLCNPTDPKDTRAVDEVEGITITKSSTALLSLLPTAKTEDSYFTFEEIGTKKPKDLKIKALRVGPK